MKNNVFDITQKLREKEQAILAARMENSFINDILPNVSDKSIDELVTAVFEGNVESGALIIKRMMIEAGLCKAMKQFGVGSTVLNHQLLRTEEE
jgi:hypothetical protein